MKAIVVFGVTAIISTAALAGDKSRMQPGMWDYTVKMEMPGMPMQMPPHNFQRCVKQEDIDKGKQYDSDRDKDCEHKNLQQTANHVSFEFSCKDGSTGTADYTFDGATTTGKTVMHSQGHDMTMNMNAKRTGDCK